MADSIQYNRVICDTNIWYRFADGSISTKLIIQGQNLFASQVAISEIGKSLKNLNARALQLKTIRLLFKYKSGEIHYPPIVFMLKLFNPKLKYDVMEFHGPLLRFTQMIANGGTIRKEDEELFLQINQAWVEEKKDVAKSLNDLIKGVKSGIKDIDEYASRDNLEDVKGVIGFFVNQNPYGEVQIREDFDWTKMELFLKVLGYYIKKIITTKQNIKPNDVDDLFQLIYVMPGDKFWTRDGPLKRLIREPGMEEYLYE
jgi:hypothetical protein